MNVTIGSLLPEVSDIESIVAECEYPAGENKTITIPQFDIPRNKWPELIAVLSDSVFVDTDADMMFCGRLKLKGTNDKIVEVWLLKSNRMYYTLRASTDVARTFVSTNDGQQILEFIKKVYADVEAGGSERTSEQND